MSLATRPCLGTPGQTCTNRTRAPRGRCPSCERIWQRARNQRRGQYAGAWQATSKAARKAQPWCSLCGSPYDLTLDHEHAQVECRRCNSAHRRDAS